MKFNLTEFPSGTHNITLFVVKVSQTVEVMLRPFIRDTVAVLSKVNYRPGCYSAVIRTVRPLTHACQRAHTHCCSCSAVLMT